MTAIVRKWGNSLALRIPRAVARQIKIVDGESVELVVSSGSLVVRPSRPRYRLDDLVAKIRPSHLHPEVDWGQSLGREE